MQPLDWIVVSAPLLVVLGICLYTQRCLRSVADFLTGGRGAGRYLLAVSRGELQGGAVVFVASFEQISHSGLALQWWWWITMPVSVLVAITGFVFYRYRETRAMTLAQFFEIRYSKPFRLFAGVIGFISGVLNFAVIPIVGARVICYFTGLPSTVSLFSVNFPTEILVMGFLLSITTILALSGGLITVILTSGMEGVISLILYLVIIVALTCTFNWNEINTVLINRPPGQSFLDPFDTGEVRDFNVWMVVMSLFLNVYGTMAWQNQGAYNAAGASPHESRMAGIVGQCLFYKGAMTVLLTCCAMVYLYHPQFTDQADEVHRALQQIPGQHTREQVLIPIALSHLLPMGVRGALCVIFIMGLFGGDGAALHSWGSLFVQDILVPLRKTPFRAAQHIRYLRLSIIGVALFAFVFGSLFHQTEYLVMWWAVTMAVFIGGAGAAIIGGLYWSKGTSAGAWSAMLTGSALSIGGILVRQLDINFPLNGMQISVAVSIIASAVYVVVSLLTCREDFNMDRMLHRGIHATHEKNDAPLAKKPISLLSRLIGIDEHFSLGDKWLAIGVFAWSCLWFLVFVFGTAWNLCARWSLPVWSDFWFVVSLCIPIVLTIISSIWLTWGSLSDMQKLFRHLREEKINPQDDGTVVDHHNLGESPRSRDERNVPASTFEAAQ
jgi:SSS family solute:Na+ symporter